MPEYTDFQRTEWCCLITTQHPNSGIYLGPMPTNREIWGLMVGNKLTIFFGSIDSLPNWRDEWRELIDNLPQFQVWANENNSDESTASIASKLVVKISREQNKNELPPVSYRL